MSGNRSRQAWQLSRALTERANVDVRIEYHGARRDSYGGWHIQWCGGPVASDMRGHVAALAARYPLIAAAHLEYVRGYTDLDEAVALLLWLDANPHEIPFLSVWTAREALAECGYPEDADEVWQARGRALLALSPAGTVGASAVDVLRRHAGVGWGNALAWLDGLVSGDRRLKVVP
ncbi:hypothetical protein ACQPXH_19330 [Nocardia sp. CA-135953]|uniref:hypothetical protein n=1 Tax=Nocardia sp. CA-135953 TaxID=3239978 RepID=UPI003D998237